MTVLLLRHATAGKSTSAPDDHLRPLDERGWEQAEKLVDTLAPYDVQRILTSPYIRCRQTVEPLARALGRAIEERPELAEGSTAEDALRLVGSLDGEAAVLCTTAMRLRAPRRREQEGLDLGARCGRGRVGRARVYIPPPA